MTATKEGNGKIRVEIQVAINPDVGDGGKIGFDSDASMMRIHRVAFKVPMCVNADFRNNPLAAAKAKELPAVRGISDASKKPSELQSRIESLVIAMARLVRLWRRMITVRTIRVLIACET
ncbi:MAG TPA: hypothetical protein VMA37_18650 [Acetobacteraceae bacterium]|nr:hypothetical protein [Acetobacteraceae bacterium]